MGTSAKARKRVREIADFGAKQNIAYKACLDLLIPCVAVDFFFILMVTKYSPIEKIGLSDHFDLVRTSP